MSLTAFLYYGDGIVFGATIAVVTSRVRIRAEERKKNFFSGRSSRQRLENSSGLYVSKRVVRGGLFRCLLVAVRKSELGRILRREKKTSEMVTCVILRYPTQSELLQRKHPLPAGILPAGKTALFVSMARYLGVAAFGYDLKLSDCSNRRRCLRKGLSDKVPQETKCRDPEGGRGGGLDADRPPRRACTKYHKVH